MRPGAPGGPRRGAASSLLLALAALASLAAVAALLATGPASSAAAGRASGGQDVELEVIPVQGNVTMLQTPSAGGNMAVLPGPDGTLLVDDQVPSLTGSVIRAVREVTDRPIRFVVNTHIHIDHIGGNAALAERGATILSHDNVRTRMLEELRIPRDGGRFMDPPPEEGRPIQTYRERVTFHMNGEEVRVFHVPPAHTDGDSFVYFAGSDVLHTGDVFRTNMYPIVDVYNGGTVAGMIEALEIALDVAGPDTKVIPGHGFGYTDREGVREVLDMVVALRERVRGMIARGMDLEEVMAADPTAEYDERWGQVPGWDADDFVPVLYNELGGAPPTVR